MMIQKARSATIIGGGMAGLLAGFYFKNLGYNVRIITDKIGGWQNIQKKPYKFGPRLIKVDKLSENLLDSFEIPKREIDIRIGYEHENYSILDYPDDNFKRKYALRTREVEPRETFLSKGENILRCWDIDYDVILEKIEDFLHEDSFLIGKFTGFKEGCIEIDNNILLGISDVVISTIPQPIFAKIVGWNNGHNYKAFNTSFVYCSPREDVDFSSFRKYDYVYSVADENFHRLNIVGDNFLCEFKGKFNTSELSKRFNIIESTTIPMAQIQENAPNDTYYSQDINSTIHFLGRYAQWQHGLVINDALQKLTEIA